MSRPERLLVVTTHSRLRSVRFFPAMMMATLQIRRQLASTEGLMRWASVVAGPTEFWTITVWRSPHAMQEFVRSGAHGAIMWRFAQWLSSFWLMRWRPGFREVGSWSGVSMARSEQEAPPVEQGTASGDVRHTVLAGIPTLREAIGPDGVATYDNVKVARLRRAQVEGAGGAVVRIAAPLHRLPLAFARLRGVRRRLRAHPELLEAAVGFGRRGEVYLLTVWTDRSLAERLLNSSWARKEASRWGDAYWALECVPENEFGQLDGRRLRTERRRRSPRAVSR
ncbi:MAG: hypothetical protein M3O70_20200 [Actinomycetota bacterium]|nr:hypothetical protein [Actinomycetota bacterium]